MSTTTEYHMCIDVEGALRWPLDMFIRFAAGAKRPDGTLLAPEDLRAFLRAELERGHVVIPLQDVPCRGFDYSGGGCPGHRVSSPPTDRSQ